MPETTDKELEDEAEPKYSDKDWDDAESVFYQWFAGYECFAAAEIANIRFEAKAEALREAAERADEAIVEWFDPFSLYDIEDDLGEIRHKVEYAIMHADEPHRRSDGV